ncbi:hypothetical protein IW262DRAFT_1479002 [Armillaria fumosa]|nr:hypothetical protein IW262DRAFT_1479002 [Armillaria fumosa]
MSRFSSLFVILAVAVGLSAGATCPSRDNDGSPLLSSSNDGNFVTCVYQAARTCTYFENGGFSSGSSVCPSSIPARRAVVERATTAATCPPRDNDGGRLLSTSNDGNFVSCDYADAGLCTYFENGGFSSGSSVCPSSIPAKRSIASAKFARAY